MAMDHYSKLAGDVRDYFCKKTMVLIRTQLPTRHFFSNCMNGNSYLWNRLYLEHSIATWKTLELNTACLRTLEIFHFRHSEINEGTEQYNFREYDFETMLAMKKLYLATTPNWFRFYHLLMPKPQQLRLEQQRTQQNQTGTATPATGSSRTTNTADLGAMDV